MHSLLFRWNCRSGRNRRRRERGVSTHLTDQACALRQKTRLIEGGHSPKSFPLRLRVQSWPLQPLISRKASDACQLNALYL